MRTYCIPEQSILSLLLVSMSDSSSQCAYWSHAKLLWIQSPLSQRNSVYTLQRPAIFMKLSTLRRLTLYKFGKTAVYYAAQISTFKQPYFRSYKLHIVIVFMPFLYLLTEVIIYIYRRQLLTRLSSSKSRPEQFESSIQMSGRCMIWSFGRMPPNGQRVMAGFDHFCTVSETYYCKKYRKGHTKYDNSKTDGRNNDSLYLEKTI